MIKAIAMIATLMATLGCLDSMEPAPASAQVSIFPLKEAALAVPSRTGYTFSMTLIVTNTGSRTIYVDQIYRRTEKLVDQKWELAVESPTAPVGLTRVIGPLQTQSMPYVVTYVPGTDFPLLEHMRGLYRVGLRMAYATDGSEPITGDAPYSRPFAVVTQ